MKLFDKGLFQVIGEKVTYSQHQFDRAQKSACCLRLLVFPEGMSSHPYILALKTQWFFLRVAVTMISKCFGKLGILVY